MALSESARLLSLLPVDRWQEVEVTHVVTEGSFQASQRMAFEAGGPFWPNLRARWEDLRLGHLIKEPLGEMRRGLAH